MHATVYVKRAQCHTTSWGVAAAVANRSTGRRDQSQESGALGSLLVVIVKGTRVPMNHLVCCPCQLVFSVLRLPQPNKCYLDMTGNEGKLNSS